MQKKSIPKMQMILVVYLLISMLSCTESKGNIKEEKVYKESQLEFSPGINKLVDSFLVVMKKKSEIIPVTGYIKFIESKENNEFKLYMSTIDNDSIYNNISINDYFVRDGFVFCVDYNLSKAIVNHDKQNEIIETVKKIGNLKYNRMHEGPEIWLIHLKNDTIQKMNKRAIDIFGPQCLNCLEWGGYIDDNGTFHPEL